VNALLRLWVLHARLGERRKRSDFDREQLVRRYAPGRSFADIGCMWSVHGAVGFLAEEAGATAVTGLDVMAPTPEFEAEHRRRGSALRFVRGDVHEPDTLAHVGEHDVVWCTGVLYHSPHPVLLLQRLHSITGQVLILATETIPDVPGLAHASVFYPGMRARDRGLHESLRPGRPALAISTEFDPAQSFGAWWWGLSAGAVRAMLAACGFGVLEEHGGPLHRTFVARPG